MIKRFYTLIAGALVLFLISCQEKGFTEPENLIKEDDMIDILYDIHLAQAMVGTYEIEDDTLDYSTEDFYHAVLDKYQLEDSVLSKSIIYYSAKPKVYADIYEKVVEKLKLEQDNIQKNWDELIIKQPK